MKAHKTAEPQLRLYEIWLVTGYRGTVAQTITLGRVKARHQPDAMQRAALKWPKHDPRKMSARAVIWLNAIRKA